MRDVAQALARTMVFRWSMAAIAAAFLVMAVLGIVAPGSTPVTGVVGRAILALLIVLLINRHMWHGDVGK